MFMNNENFFSNKGCKYFPCHKGIKSEEFNCMFCYCPLYMLGERCGGNFIYTEGGIKDCSGCIIPHIRKNYDYMMERLKQVIDETRRK